MRRRADPLANGHAIGVDAASDCGNGAGILHFGRRVGGLIVDVAEVRSVAVAHGVGQGSIPADAIQPGLGGAPMLRQKSASLKNFPLLK